MGGPRCGNFRDEQALTGPERTNVDLWDDRVPALLIHGSFVADPAETWIKQRPLAADRPLSILHRRGYGRGRPRSSSSFDGDVEDGLAALGAGAHLVGFSYGGVISLLMAAREPQLVRSLTLIEPPAFGVAPNHSEVRTLVERLSVLQPSAQFTPEAYRTAFLRALGGSPQEEPVFTSAERQAALAAMNEDPPGDASLDLTAVAAAAIPTLVVTGDWHPALDAIADELVRVLGAERAVISGARHAVQLTGEPFNRRLREFSQATERDRG
jgi:pimeloyl-ACP methyl ester carboxylesterase